MILDRIRSWSLRRSRRNRTIAISDGLSVLMDGKDGLSYAVVATDKFFDPEQIREVVVFLSRRSRSDVVANVHDGLVYFRNDTP